jgi:sugar/nucleoside kinase (ribokinase family)
MENKKQKNENKPTCIGTGLVALDIIINGKINTPTKIFAGGSCGNIMAILSLFGWETFPIARLKSNNAAKKLILDFKKWKVNTNLISIKDDGSTPIIIQRIKEDKLGNPIHKFEFRNPNDGSWFPGYKPVLSAEVPDIIKKTKPPLVFYFDRVNRASIDFAKFYKSQGSLIYFEPSSIGEMRLFEECLQVTDVIKFSSDRIKEYGKLFPQQRVSLEIETQGKDGLKYRFDLAKKEKKWNSIGSHPINDLVDSSGAGDWLSAGIILKLGKTGYKGFKKTDSKNVLSAIKFGQSLGSLNCMFDGARGLMYNLNKEQIELNAKKIQTFEEISLPLKKKTKIKDGKEILIESLY